LLGALCELGSQARELLELSGLSEDDLRDVKVRCGWRIVRRLVDEGKIINHATVFSAGRSFGLFSEMDGPWLASLTAANILTRDSFAQHCADLRRRILGGAIAEDFESLIRSLRQGDYSTPSVVARLDQAINELSRADAGDSTAARDIIEQAENWERRERTGSTPGILTRVKMLDQITTPTNGVGGTRRSSG
jgi:replicative DNA helicase